MAKPKGVNQKAKWRAHSIRLARYAKRVQSVYDTLNKEVARMVLRTGYDGSRPFHFSDYPATRRMFDDVRAQFVSEMRSVIYSGTSEEWKESNLVQDLLADKALKFYGATSYGTKHRVYYQTNSEALKAFQQRKDNGLNLSQKLWNQSASYKEEMEFCLSSAIEKGTSAVKLSKRLSKYLNDFPSLKKDYKEKYGKAVTCQDCEYRSIRLARSEINMAYRKAEQERWKQFDFVLGYEVKLSGSHPQEDICDSMQGKYPKDFVFMGWHPNCMCYVIPVLKTEDQFWGNEEVKEIEEPPQNFTDWLENNAERIDKAAENDTLPYWYTENPQYVKIEPRDNAFLMTDEVRGELMQRGFNSRRLISSEAYNASAMAGFDILRFDKTFEEIFDEYSVYLKTKELKDAYDRKVSLRYIGNTQSGKEVEFYRIFRHEKINGGEVPVVDHKLFVLPDELQRKGISKRVFREMITQYENAGIQRAYISANIDKGALCWAKYGALAEKRDIDFIAEAALKEGRISNEEYSLIKTYLSKFESMVPMQDLAYAPYGEKLLLGESWHGYLDLKSPAQLEYLHRYLGM